MYQSSLNIKHKHRTHLYWGIDKTTGARVRVNEVSERGLLCNCKCAACGGDFIARKGEINKHHFAHQSNYECVYANEIAVYQEVAEYLKRAKILLPVVLVKIGQHTEPVRQPLTSNCSEIYYYCDPEQYPPLMVGKADGRAIRIVLQFGEYYTGEDIDLFRKEAIRNNWDCLVVRLPEIANEESLSRNMIWDALVNESSKQWIYNNVQTEWEDRVRRAAKMPPRVEGPYGEKLHECPIHAFWRNGKPIADADDCWHCEFNYEAYPKCKCLAQEFIQTLGDLERTAYDRYRRRDAVREENDRKHEQAIREQEQREKMRNFRRMNQYYTPPRKTPRTVCIAPSYEEQLRMGKLEVQSRFGEAADDLIYDRFNRRWLKCLICGEIKPEGEMAIYGGGDGLSKGTCRDCSRK